MEGKEIIKQWRVNAREEFSENLDFLKRTRSSSDNIKTVQNLHEETFSKVDCLDCANCCKTTPALITRPDAKRVAKHLGLPPKTFLRKYTIEDINGDLVMKSVPCPFLNNDNTCNIYEVRPEACRRYPHTDEKEYFRRARLNAQNTIVCPAAHHIVRRLKAMIEF